MQERRLNPVGNHQSVYSMLIRYFFRFIISPFMALSIAMSDTKQILRYHIFILTVSCIKSPVSEYCDHLLVENGIKL